MFYKKNKQKTATNFWREKNGGNKNKLFSLQIKVV